MIVRTYSVNAASPTRTPSTLIPTVSKLFRKRLSPRHPVPIPTRWTRHTPLLQQTSPISGYTLWFPTCFLIKITTFVSNASRKLLIFGIAVKMRMRTR